MDEEIERLVIGVRADTAGFARDVDTTLALCWRVERRDGICVGLTSHDRDLVVDGVNYRAAPGMTPSAVARGDGLDAATMDVAGALTGAAITEGGGGAQARRRPEVGSS